MGRGGYVSEAFSFSGILKIIEIILTFITIVLHRHGGHNRSYIFFSTFEGNLQWNDKTAALDTENLGNGTLVTFLIISPVLLVCYVLDGRYAVQSTFLEWLWNLLGACMFMGTGVKTILVWMAAKELQETGRNSEVKGYEIGLALGGMCVSTSLVYFVDFVYAFAAKRRLNRQPY